MVQNFPSRRPNRHHRVTNILWMLQSEPEVCHAALLTGLARLALENQDISATRRLSLNEIALGVDRDHTENSLVKA
jgi:hypothetical protein